MSYVYIHSERDLWTVGFYAPDGKWQPESDHDLPGEAATRVHHLNGGCDTDLLAALRTMVETFRPYCECRGDDAVIEQATAAIAKAVPP